jgi:type I restriction enzyme S subunit
MRIIPNKSGWIVHKFEDFVENVREPAMPNKEDSKKYIGLKHLDSRSLHVRRWGTKIQLKGTKFRMKKGDLLFARRNAYLRRVAIAPHDGLFSAHGIIFRPKADVVLPDFLSFFLLSDVFMDRAIKISVGSLSPTINWGTLRYEEFSLPPLDEQKRLADLLWSVDEVIESYYNLLNKLIISKNSLLKQNYRDIQKELHAISYIAEINPRIERKNIKKDMTVSFVTMADISKEGYIINKEDRKYSEVEKGFTPFKDGDILFAKITPCMENGKGARASDLINGLGFGSTELHVIRPKDKDDIYYLYYLTRMFHLRKKAEQLMTGSAGQKRVPSNFFDIYKFNLPEKEKRNSLGDQMRKYDYEIDHLKKNIATTKNIQKQIINQMFGGKL